MGWLSRLLSPAVAAKPVGRTVEATHLAPDRDDARLAIVGEQSYQAQLIRVGGPLTTEGPSRRDHMAALLLEPKNHYDPNAIVVQIDAGCVGYLSREDAIAYGPVLRWLAERGRILAADAYLNGGWRRPGDAGSVGCILHLGSPAECIADLVTSENPLRTDHAWAGQTVVFTGDSRSAIGGVQLDDNAIRWLATKAGLLVLPRVTKKVQLVVDCEATGSTGNALKARDYGIPIIAEPAFWAGVGLTTTALSQGGAWKRPHG